MRGRLSARPEVGVLDRQRSLRVSHGRIERLAARVLVLEGAPAGQIGVLLVGDRRIRELNRRWRGLDRVTDVLAFSQREGKGGALHPEVLGDVVIALPTAARQAREAGHSVAAEVDLLLVHGVLHLLGYEHEGDPVGAGVMRRRQAAILRGWRP